jgi:quercetin dioxygenase-like cupin family protein
MSAMSDNWNRRSILRASAGLAVPASLAAYSDTAAASTEKPGAGTRLLPKPPTTKGSPEMFTGDVWVDVIARGEGPSRLRVSAVRFAPCARTAWHRHSVGQTLHVTEGIGLVRARGGRLITMRPGDTVHTPPGEWHWHGAAPEHFVIHLAMWEGDEVEWGDHVTDAEYYAR